MRTFLTLVLFVIATGASAQVRVGSTFLPTQINEVSAELPNLCAADTQCFFRFFQDQAGGEISLTSVSIKSDWQKGMITISRHRSTKEMAGRTTSDPHFKCVFEASNLHEAYATLYSENASDCE